MKRNFKRYTVTAALPYANGPIHIGHIAGAYIPADIFVRYLRLQGKDVVFVCGSDEHGAAITIQAKKEGISPKEIVDKYHQIIKSAFDGIDMSFDIYHRTSSDLHHETSSAYFKKLYDKGVFIEKESEQYYDETFKQFLADRYIKGTCPKCDYDSAYGDQCENCGSTLSPTELINPVSTLSGATPVIKKTTHWYLPLNNDTEWLLDWINNGKLNNEKLHEPAEWKKNVLGQCNSWLKDGLQPRAITRDLDWGVKVPLANAEGKVLYVWLDAPIGYISATKQWALDNNKDWEPYWKDEDTALYHFIGKDNIVFHTIIFPSLLKAHGDFILPQNVPGNEFMNMEGKKISTSRGWVINIHDYLEQHPTKTDELRYVLTANMPETKDSEFTWKDFQSRINGELVATFGNFVNRVMVLMKKYYSGEVPSININLKINNGETEGNSTDFNAELKTIKDKINRVGESIEKFRYREALSRLIEFASYGNGLLQFNEPWKKIKEDEETVKVIMLAAVNIVAGLAVASQPFLPKTAEKLFKMLSLNSEDFTWGNAAEIIQQKLIAGHQLNEPEILFEKIEDEFVEKEIEKLNQMAQNAAAMGSESKVEIKDEIQYDDFSKMDFRIGTIIEAEKVPKADKLLKLTVDLGFEKRTIVSGIAKFFKAEDVLNKQVMVLVNLAPRKLRGIMSEGMILMAENKDGELKFVSPEGLTDNGSSVS